MLNIARTFSVRILPHWSRDNLILSITLLILLSLMLLFIVTPLAAMLVKSVQNEQGEFVGLAYFAQYFSSAALWQSLRNTLVAWYQCDGDCRHPRVWLRLRIDPLLYTGEKFVSSVRQCADSRAFITARDQSDFLIW